MRQLAVIICNYNKKDYLEKCIKSVFAQSYNNFDIYVVDNASSDGSLEMLKTKFLGFVNICANPKNLGGSGGFNTGIKKAMVKNYEYLLLLDNDVVLGENAVKAAVEYLESHEDVGLLGSKLYQMDNPKLLQEHGAYLCFDSFSIKPTFKGVEDNEQVPMVQVCDYVPACSLFVRTSALSYVGIMDDTNFIYWDDIEWGYRFNQSGFKVVSYGGSKAYHKMGAAARANTFATYYFWRNRVKFFAAYLDEEQLERFCRQYLTELYQGLYACSYQKKFNTMKSLMWAYDDALNGIFGEALPNRILPADKVPNRFSDTFGGIDKALLFLPENLDAEISNKIQNELKAVGVKVTIGEAGQSNEGFDVVCQGCSHIFDVENGQPGVVYIDKYLNLIECEQDLDLCRSYKRGLDFFMEANYSLMLEKLLGLRI